MAKRLHKHLPKLSLHKTIFQARYKPDLRFYTLLFPAAEKFSEYPHWKTDRLSVTLWDPEKRYSLTIDHKAFSYDQDSDELSDEEGNVEKALTELPEALDIKAYTRLGFRRKYLIPVDMTFEQLVSILNVKLLSQDDRLIRIMPEKAEDLTYMINSSEEPFRFHITIGPVRKHEVPLYVTFNKEDHLESATADEVYQGIVQAYPDTAVFLDIDIYRAEEELPTKDAVSFVQGARHRIDKIATGLRDYFFSTDMEG